MAVTQDMSRSLIMHACVTTQVDSDSNGRLLQVCPQIMGIRRGLHDTISTEAIHGEVICEGLWTEH